MFTDAADNLMLAALTSNFISLHNGYPGLTGANEITGGSPAYARLTASYTTPSGGARTQVGTLSINVGAGTTVSWVGDWSTVTAGTFLGSSPNGGNPLRYSVYLATNLVVSPAHGYAANQSVVFYGKGTVPGGVTAGNSVFVVNPTVDTFQVSLTSGGAPIALTSTGSGQCFVSTISPVSYASQSTHSLPSGGQSLNA